MTKLTRYERETIERMREGWVPFPMQLEKTSISLLRKGMACFSTDDRDRTILVLTDEGKAVELNA
jgi:hypothetical protein